MSFKFRFSIVAAILAVTGLIGLWLLAVRDRGTSPPSPQARMDANAASVSQFTQATAPREIRQGTGESEEATMGADQRRRDLLATIAAFDTWFESQRRGAAPSASTGLELARQRRSALKTLIALDPQEALARAIPPGLRSELSDEIVAELETPVDAFGQFEVLVSCFGPSARTERFTTVAGKRYETHTYGRRLNALSKDSIAVHGIVIDERLALSDQSYRLLSNQPPATGRQRGPGILAVVGSETKEFASLAELASWQETISRAESSPDVNTGRPGAMAATPTGWTIGEKRVLWIRAEFSDDPGLPGSDEEIGTMMAKIAEFYGDVSNGRCTMTTTILPGAVRLSKPKSYYETARKTFTELWNEAAQLARDYDAANGGSGTYHPDQSDRWIVWTKKVNVYGFGGIANLGAKGVLLNSVDPVYTAPAAAHELGHNHGLFHSHSWIPKGTSPIGSGEHDEYGDAFDIMGHAILLPGGHFNTVQKEKLGYLTSLDTSEVTTGGVYRLYRHDHRDADGIRALKISAGSYQYWIEYVQQIPRADFTPISRMREGVLVRWGQYPYTTGGPGASYLIDSTIATPDDPTDAPVAIGELFTGPNETFSFAPILRGGTAPNEWMDVRVTFGTIGENRAPSVIAAAPAAAIPVRSDVTFAASATDPDGDAVHFSWDFGDQSSSPTGQSITHRFLKGGTYTVQCTARDGRGGSATSSFTVTVDDPLTNWTRSSVDVPGSVYLTGLVHDGLQFVAVGYGIVLTSPDGLTWTRRTAVRWQDYFDLTYGAGRFVAVGFWSSSPQIPAAIATSVDGITWEDVSPANLPGQLRSVAFGASCFVAVAADGTILRSPDGITWTEVGTKSEYPLWAVKFAGGRFVVVGENGTILTSTDGITWENRSLLTESQFSGLGYLHGQWITSDGRAYISTDGRNWDRRYMSLDGLYGISAQHLTKWNGPDLLLTSTTASSIAFSENGIQWASVNLTEPGTFLSIAGSLEVNGVVTVLTSDGTVFRTTRKSQVVATPSIKTDLRHATATAGGNIVFDVVATGSDLTYQWQHNGAALAGITGATLGIYDVQPSDAGIYTAVVTNPAGTIEVPAILGLTTTAKLVGTGEEFPNILHGGTGFTYDQLLLGGPSAAFTADAGQITRLSYIDLTDDIVQVEFSGPGTLAIVLEGSSGPAAPVNYQQATPYMKGHAGIVVTGATENTHLSVFSVGRGTAVNQALFDNAIDYDGLADIAFIAIQSSDGKFGGLRTANASYWNTQGFTGVYAPGVEFTGPVFVHDINARDTATPVLMIGSALERTWITGGDLLQANGRAVKVTGLTQLKFADGVTSHYRTAADTGEFLVAKPNQARLERDGVDVTAEIVVNP